MSSQAALARVRSLALPVSDFDESGNGHGQGLCVTTAYSILTTKLYPVILAVY